MKKNEKIYGIHSVAEFIKISRAGFAESQPHDVDVM